MHGNVTVKKKAEHKKKKKTFLFGNFFALEQKIQQQKIGLKFSYPVWTENSDSTTLQTQMIFCLAVISGKNGVFILEDSPPCLFI